MSATRGTDAKISGAEVEETEKSKVTSPTTSGEGEEIKHQVHSQTILIVLAVYTVYVAGIWNIVCAGAFARNIGIALGETTTTTWLVQVVVILITILSPPIAVAADLWGRKWLLVSLTALGVVGCALTGAATSMTMALAGQGVSGIACSSQVLIHAIPSEVLPRRLRPIAQAGVNVAAATGTFIPLLFGGAVTRNYHHDGYRSLFYVNAGLFAIGGIAVAILYNPPLRDLQVSLTQRQKLARLDWGGVFLLSTGLTLFCIALVWSQNPYQWTDPHIIAPFVIGCVFSIGLVVYETRFKKDGIFHHSLFQRDRNFGLSVFCIFVEGVAFFSCNNYFAFEMAILFEPDSLLVGVRYSISFFVFALSTTLTGLYCTRTKQLRLPTVVGFALFTAFMVAMSTATLGSGTAIWGYPVIFGFALGICLNTLITAGQLGTPPDLIASASGLLITTRSLGASIALAMYNAIFSKTLSSGLNDRVPAAVLPLGLPPTSIGPLIGALTSGQTYGIMDIPGVNAEIVAAAGHAVHESFLVAFRFIWITAACFTAVATIVSFFLIDPKKEFNQHIDAPAEKDQVLREQNTEIRG